MKISKLLLVFASIVLLPSTTLLAVPIPGLFNTGVDNSGTPLPNGAVDPHWVLSTGPAGVPTAIAGDPIPPNWIPNTVSSRWVTPFANGIASPGFGTYTYDLTFSLAGFNPATAVITGDWSSDNTSNVLLNGSPIASHSGGGSAFLSFDSFTASAGFLPGLNTLTIQVNNFGGPSGAHVTELRGDAQLIPEPASVALIATGAIGLLSRRRRCRASQG